MQQLTRRKFTDRSLKWGGAFSLFSLLGLPATVSASASAFFDKVKNDVFLKRDDIGNAVKSYYMTYDCTTPYPHKFNEVVGKAQLRSLQFYMDKGMAQAYVEHYMSTMDPVFEEIKQAVEKEGKKKALSSLFEDNSSAYQLFEHIKIKRNRRIFPCPYKELLEHCKTYLTAFTIEWNDVCNHLCIPMWTGVGDRIGVPLKVLPGETCTVKIDTQKTS